MKAFTLFISLMILSCNSQKEVVKKQDLQGAIPKTGVIKNSVVDTLTNKTTNQQTVKNANTTNQTPQIEVLTEGSHGGYETAKYLVIKNEKELQNIYTKINMMRRPGIPVPKIDFKNEMVIALFMGQKNSGGYSISVQGVNTINDKTEITIKESKPKGMATSVICQPFYFCKVKRIDKDLAFKKVE